MLTEKSDSPSVEIIDFSKSYGNTKKSTAACKNINVEFNAGSITGLLGPNGAGKTTLLKAICGVHYQDSGTVCVRINGNVFENSPEDFRKLTGFLPETPVLENRYSVIEILEDEALLFGMEKEESEKNIRNAIKLCSLEEVLSKKVSELSKGYRQRVSFAKVLVHNPKILILDEFSGGLDPSQIKQMREIIKTLSKDRAVILSTHHLEEASALCDRMYILSKGTIKACGTEKEIIAKTKKHNLEEAFISLTEER